MTSQLYSPVLPTGETKDIFRATLTVHELKTTLCQYFGFISKASSERFKKKLKIFKECIFRLLSSSYALSLQEILLLDVFFIDLIITAQLL